MTPDQFLQLHKDLVAIGSALAALVTAQVLRFLFGK